MIQVELPLAKPLTPSQLRSIEFLVRARHWPRDAAIRHFEVHNRRVAERRTARQLAGKKR